MSAFYTGTIITLNNMYVTIINKESPYNAGDFRASWPSLVSEGLVCISLVMKTVHSPEVMPESLNIIIF